MLIAHLSDPHMRPEGRLYHDVVDSNATFDLAIDTLRALRPAPDLVLIGGDLVDEGTAAEYETVRRALRRIEQPIYAIPGNHDEREAFRACFSDADFATEKGPLHFDTRARWPVRVIGFDVTVPGHHYGAIDEDAHRWLDARLAEHASRPTMILMHQPPVDTGISFIDTYKCLNGDRLADAIRRRSNVERVLCGHVHRYVNGLFAGVPLIIAPSTASAIALRLEDNAEPASFLEPPAFLLHHWRSGQGMMTHWLPAGGFRGPLSFF